MIFDLPGFSFSYYGLVYLMGFVLFWFMPWPRTPALWPRETLLMRFNVALYTAIGAIVGGRLGYVVVYDPHYYLAHPEMIVRLDLGGMSYMGGVAGIAVALLLISRVMMRLNNRTGSSVDFMSHTSCANLPLRSRMSLFYHYCDRAVITALVIIPLGRIANFLNAELYGTPSDLPWAFIFSTADLQPRHPVQLYEAIAEGPLLALLLGFVYFRAWIANLRRLMLSSSDSAGPADRAGSADSAAATTAGLSGTTSHSNGLHSYYAHHAYHGDKGFSLTRFVTARARVSEISFSLHPGTITLTYLAGYSVARFLCEFVREPDPQLGYIIGHLSMGQLQCIVLLVVALGLMQLRALRRRRNALT